MALINIYQIRPWGSQGRQPELTFEDQRILLTLRPGIYGGEMDPRDDPLYGVVEYRGPEGVYVAMVPGRGTILEPFGLDAEQVWAEAAGGQSDRFGVVKRKHPAEPT